MIRNKVALVYMIIGMNKLNSLGSCRNKSHIIEHSFYYTRQAEDVSLCVPMLCMLYLNMSYFIYYLTPPSQSIACTLL